MKKHGRSPVPFLSSFAHGVYFARMLILQPVMIADNVHIVVDVYISVVVIVVVMVI